MSQERQPPGPLDATLPLHTAEVEGWDDSTRLDPPGTIPGADPTGQEIAAALGRALQSHLPGRDLGEDETVLPRGGIPAPPPRAPTQAARPSLMRDPVRVPESPTETPAIVWADEPATASSSATSPLADPGAPSGPFGVDSTELDLDLWSVQDGLQAAIVGSAAAGQLAPGAANKHDADWGDATVRMDEAPEALRALPEEDAPPWETEPKPWAQPKPIDLRPAPFAVKLPPPMNAPPDAAMRPSQPPNLGPGTPRGLVERAGGFDLAAGSSRESMSAPPRVVLGRPLVDPASSPAPPRRSLSRVMPAGPASLLDEPPLPAGDEALSSDFGDEGSTNTFARFGRLSVSKAKRWLSPRAKNTHNPVGRPGGVGVPVGAERRSYRRAVKLLAIVGVLVIGALLGFLLTVTFAGP